MSATPNFTALLDDEVTRRAEEQAKGAVNEFLGGLSEFLKPWGYEVVPAGAQPLSLVKDPVEPEPAHLLKATPANVQTIDWSDYDKALRTYKRNVKAGKPETPKGRNAKLGVIAAGEALRNEFGVSQRMLSKRANRSDGWYSLLRWAYAPKGAKLHTA